MISRTTLRLRDYCHVVVLNARSAKRFILEGWSILADWLVGVGCGYV